MNLIGVQFDIAWRDKRANYDKVRRLLGPVRIAPGSLIVLPEMFVSGFSMDAGSVAEAPDGDTARFLADLARDTGAYLLGGMATKEGPGRARNEAVVVGPDGVETVRFSKLHPFSLSGEAASYAPGDRVRTFAWARFTVAPFVCYDLRFPEVFREASRLGADLFVVIANWPRARHAHWEVLLRARAIENQAYVIGVNRCGADPSHDYAGGSRIVDPRGEIMAVAGTGEELVQATPDPDGLALYRGEFPALRDRRFG